MTFSIRNILGRKFGRLFVEKFAYIKNHRAYWECLCNCGNKIFLPSNSLVNNNTKSCGCLNTDRIIERSRAQLVQQTFGKLLVSELSHIKNKKTFWKCVCECGNITIVSADKLKNGHTKSCGCLRKELLRKRLSGSSNHMWKGGITSKNRLIRSSAEYKHWRMEVFERDLWACRKCGKKGGILHAHHKFPFSKFPRLYFSISNGITLCKKCHRNLMWQEIHFI